MTRHFNMCQKQNILDTKLNFNKHIDNICKKANATLGFIRRNTHYCQCYVKVDAYNTYVRPILDYAAFVWSPHTANSINKLESVQRRAACYVMSDYNRYSSVNNAIHPELEKSEATKRYPVSNYIVQDIQWSG